MKTFHEVYLDVLKQETAQGRKLEGEYDPYHLDCLLHPERHAPVIFTDQCEQCEYDKACENSCVFDFLGNMCGLVPSCGPLTAG